MEKRQMSENREKLYDMLRKLTGVYTERNRNIGQCNNIPDCPVMGSGKIAVAVEGDYVKQTYYISKTDFWYAGGKNVFDYDSDTVDVEYPPFTIQPAALGGLTLQIGTKNSSERTVSGYRQEQDLLLAEVRSELPFQENESLRIRSFAPLHDNYMFVEISGNEEPVPITAELWLHEGDESCTKADLENITLWCKTRYHDIWGIEAAMAVKVIGAADMKAYTDQKRKSWIEFTVKPHQPVWIAVAVAGGKDEMNSEKKASHMAADVEVKGIREAENRHRKAWEEYWLKSYVFFNDKELERFYYGALYELACITDPEGHVPPGIAGGWIHNENPLWSGNYTMNYNAQAPFWGVYSANRPEMGMPFVRMVMDYLEEGKKLAEEKGTKGVLIPVHINPWGNCDLRDTVCQKSNASLAAVNFIWQYEFTQDLEFLKNTAYPYIMECAEFWEDNICLEDEKYVVAEAAQRERWPGDRNPNSDLAHVRKIFDAALRWSQTLRVDADKRSHWREVIGNLSDYPTMVYEDKIVFKEAENRNQISFFGVGDNPVNLDHVYPIEALEMQTDEKLRIIARNTVEIMNSWNQDNAFPRIFSQAVRAGWPGDDILRRFKERISQNLYPSEILRNNQTIVPHNHGLEAVGAIEFLNSMLARAYGGMIEIFPGWPENKTVSFENLRTRGAFLVSAKLENAEVSDVRILSEHGGTCSLKSPWKDRKIIVRESTEGQKQSVETKCEDSVISWNTKAGGIYVIEPAAEHSEEKAEANVQKLPVPLMVIPIVDTESSPRSGQGDGSIDLILTPEKKRSSSITVNVHMSDGTILKDYRNFELSSENESVVKAENRVLTAGDNAGTAKVKIVVRENGGTAENQITVAVVKRTILSDISVETGAGYDGWKYPFPLMWDAECVISGIGMSGPDMDAVKRGNPYGLGMWLTPENPGENAWIIFDLKKNWILDEMWVWNYNCWEDGKEKHVWGCGSRCGMKKVKIFYSSDKIVWKELKGDGYPYEFAKAEGNAFSPATNLNNQEKTPVRFHGVKARYVKIAADETISEGNWGGSRYGLSAVRFSVKYD